MVLCLDCVLWSAKQSDQALVRLARIAERDVVETFVFYFPFFPGGALAEITLSFPFYFVGVLGAILVLLLLLFLTESLHKDENGMPIRRTGGPEVVMAKNKFLWPTVACMALAAFAGQCALCLALPTVIQLIFRYIEINWSTVFGLLGSEQYHLNPCQNGGVLSIGVLAMIAVNIVYVPVTRE